MSEERITISIDDKMKKLHQDNMFSLSTLVSAMREQNSKLLEHYVSAFQRIIEAQSMELSLLRSLELQLREGTISPPELQRLFRSLEELRKEFVEIATTSSNGKKGMM